MSTLARDGTTKPVSRGHIFRRERGQGNFVFSVQLTTSRIGNLTRLIHTLLYVMTIHSRGSRSDYQEEMYGQSSRIYSKGSLYCRPSTNKIISAETPRRQGGDDHRDPRSPRHRGVIQSYQRATQPSKYVPARYTIQQTAPLGYLKDKHK